MPSKKKTSVTPQNQERRNLDELGKMASQVVLEAAAVLEEELAAGLITARKVSQRLVQEQRFEAEDFTDSLNRFRETGQQLIEVARGRAEDLRSDSTQELLQRFLNDAKEGLDTLVDLLAAGPDLANRLMKTRTQAPVDEVPVVDQSPEGPKS